MTRIRSIILQLTEFQATVSSHRKNTKILNPAIIVRGLAATYGAGIMLSYSIHGSPPMIAFSRRIRASKV